MSLPAAPSAADTAIASVAELLAHALELEYASQAHYEQLADSMDVHHNVEVAELFRRLAALSGQHASDVAERAGDLTLPRIPPWAFMWECPDAPEGSDCLDPDVSYQMRTTEAITVALHKERRGHAYYLYVAATATDADARRLASTMAAEEAQHVALLESMLTAAGGPQPSAPEDLDPPHVPD
jgi:rubrerythrin